jgi:hypothetical protein
LLLGHAKEPMTEKQITWLGAVVIALFAVVYLTLLGVR